MSERNSTSTLLIALRSEFFGKQIGSDLANEIADRIEELQAQAWNRRAVPDLSAPLLDALNRLLSHCDVSSDNETRYEQDVTYAREVVAQAALRTKAEVWRPIDSAPKDGTEILLWTGWTIAGRWVETPQRGKANWFTEPAGINPIFMVTHWMPLPPGPEKAHG